MEGFQYLRNMCGGQNCMWLDQQSISEQNINSSRVEGSQNFDVYALQSFGNQRHIQNILKPEHSQLRQIYKRYQGQSNKIQKPQDLKSLASNHVSIVSNQKFSLSKVRNERKSKFYIPKYEMKQLRNYQQAKKRDLGYSNKPLYFSQTSRHKKVNFLNNRSLGIQVKSPKNIYYQPKKVYYNCKKVNQFSFNCRSLQFGLQVSTPEFHQPIKQKFIQKIEIQDYRQNYNDKNSHINFEDCKSLSIQKNSIMTQKINFSHVTNIIPINSKLDNQKNEQNAGKSCISKQQNGQNGKKIVLKSCKSQINSNIHFTAQNSQRSHNQFFQYSNQFSLKENSLLKQNFFKNNFDQQKRSSSSKSYSSKQEKTAMPCIQLVLKQQQTFDQTKHKLAEILPETPVGKLGFINQNNLRSQRQQKSAKSVVITNQQKMTQYRIVSNPIKPFFKGNKNRKKRQNEENDEQKQNQYSKEQGIQYYGKNTVISNFSHTKDESQLYQSFAIFRMRDHYENAIPFLLSSKLGHSQKQNNCSQRSAQRQSQTNSPIDQVPSYIQRQEVESYRVQKKNCQFSNTFSQSSKNKSMLFCIQKQKGHQRKKNQQQISYINQQTNICPKQSKNKDQQAYLQQNQQQKDQTKVTIARKKNFNIKPIDTNLIGINSFLQNMTIKVRHNIKNNQFQKQKMLQQKFDRIRKIKTQQIQQCQYQQIEPQRIGNFNIISKALVCAPIHIGETGLIFCVQKLPKVEKSLAQMLLSLDSPFLIRGLYFGGENQQYNYFVSEFFQQSLDQQVSIKGGKIDEFTCKNYLQNILKGLEYLQNMGFTGFCFSKKDVFISLSGTIAKLNPISIFALNNLVNKDQDGIILSQSQHERSRAGKRYLAILMHELIYGYTPSKNDMIAILKQQMQSKIDLNFINRRIDAKLSSDCKNFLKELISISLEQSKKTLGQLVQHKWFQLID